jgi:hypothetical protein
MPTTPSQWNLGVFFESALDGHRRHLWSSYCSLDWCRDRSPVFQPLRILHGCHL